MASSTLAVERLSFSLQKPAPSIGWNHLHRATSLGANSMQKSRVPSPGLGFRAGSHNLQRGTGRHLVQTKFSWFGGTKSEAEEEKKKQAEDQTSEKEEEAPKKKYSKLALAVLVDCIGLLVDKSFLDFDFGWSPVAAFIIQRMYNAPLLTAVGLVEQVIPGVNYLPTATLGWVAESYPQLQWVSRLPFMGALAKTKEAQKGFFGWPFGGKKD